MGLTPDGIVLQTGLGRTTVYRYKNVGGLTPSAIEKNQKAALVQGLFARGLTPAEVSKDSGLSHAAIYRHRMLKPIGV